MSSRVKGPPLSFQLSMGYGKSLQNLEALEFRTRLVVYYDGGHYDTLVLSIL